jgi:hypothetical protein
MLTTTALPGVSDKEVRTAALAFSRDLKGAVADPGFVSFPFEET